MRFFLISTLTCSCKLFKGKLFILGKRQRRLAVAENKKRRNMNFCNAHCMDHTTFNFQPFPFHFYLGYGNLVHISIYFLGFNPEDVESQICKNGTFFSRPNAKVRSNFSIVDQIRF